MKKKVGSAEIGAIIFDAVGTVIVPEPRPVEVYCSLGRQHGMEISPSEARTRFHSAYRHEDALDAQNGWRTDEDRERQRWHRIVSDVFAGIGSDLAITHCFEDLWAWFAQSKAWRVIPESAQLITSATRAGLILGIGSNFDRRLHSVLDGLPELAEIKTRVISSTVGWRKPDARFFSAVVTAVAVEPARILFVGDDPVNDVAGAIAAGLRGELISELTLVTVGAGSGEVGSARDPDD